MVAQNNKPTLPGNVRILKAKKLSTTPIGKKPRCIVCNSDNVHVNGIFIPSEPENATWVVIYAICDQCFILSSSSQGIQKIEDAIYQFLRKEGK